LKYSIVFRVFFLGFIAFVCLSFVVLTLKRNSEEKNTGFPNEKERAIEKIDNTKKLLPYLTSPDLETRKAGIIQLGRVGKPHDIDLLMKILHEEPLNDAPHIETVGRTIQEEIVLAITTIDGAKAKKQLMKIVKEYIETGAKFKDHLGRNIFGVITAKVIYEGLESLRNFPDKEVDSFVCDIEASNKIDDWSIKEAAWSTHLAIQMKRQGIQNIEDQTRFLVSQLNGSGVGPDAWARPGIKTPQAIRNGAVQSTLANLGKDALPNLQDFSQTLTDKRKVRAIKEVIESIKLREGIKN